MEIILNDTTVTEPEKYTGDPTKWPNGLYECDLEGMTHKIAVHDGNAVWLETFPQTSGACGWNYTRMPGYTGRIASITPEREAE